MHTLDAKRLVLQELYRCKDEPHVRVGSMPIVGIELIHEMFLDLEREGLIEFVRRPIPWPAWCVRLTPLGVTTLSQTPHSNPSSSLERGGDLFHGEIGRRG